MRGRREDITVQQQEDIAAVGSLMVRLAGGAAGGPALQSLAGHLSPHLMHLLASLQNSHIRDCHMVKCAVIFCVGEVDSLRSDRALVSAHVLLPICLCSSQPWIVVALHCVAAFGICQHISSCKTQVPTQAAWQHLVYSFCLWVCD